MAEARKCRLPVMWPALLQTRVVELLILTVAGVEAILAENCVAEPSCKPSWFRLGAGSSSVSGSQGATMNMTRTFWLGLLAAFAALMAASIPALAQQRQRPPNILVIMGDDVGWFNIGAYHRGIMAGKTPNLDKLASEGMMFTDYYAEASCTAGRANFITGELPIRT